MNSFFSFFSFFSSHSLLLSLTLFPIYSCNHITGNSLILNLVVCPCILVKPIPLKQFFFETYTKGRERQGRIGACTRRIRRWRRRKRTTSRHPLNGTSRDTDTQRRLTGIKDGTRNRRKRRWIGKMDLQRLGIDGPLPFTRCVEFEVNGERLLCVLGEDFLTSWNF